MRRLILAAFGFLCVLLAATPSEAYRAVASCPSAVAIWSAGATGVDPVVDVNGNFCVSGGDAQELPIGASFLTISATGTTGATAATIPAVASVTNWICGFSVKSNATAAVTGNITVAGVVTATMNFTHWTAPLASGIGETTQTFSPCIPSSAVNTAIVITGPAPGTGGTISVSAWGYKK